MRDNIIKCQILIQEEKYLNNLKVFKKQLQDSKDPRQRVCSRLLQHFSDNHVLNVRTPEQDMKIIKAQIDEHLPLLDPTKELKLKKEATKEKKSKTETASPNPKQRKVSTVRNSMRSSDEMNSRASS